jgi:hypothetical protein
MGMAHLVFGTQCTVGMTALRQCARCSLSIASATFVAADRIWRRRSWRVASGSAKASPQQRGSSGLLTSTLVQNLGSQRAARLTSIAKRRRQTQERCRQRSRRWGSATRGSASGARSRDLQSRDLRLANYSFGHTQGSPSLRCGAALGRGAAEGRVPCGRGGACGDGCCRARTRSSSLRSRATSRSIAC